MSETDIIEAINALRKSVDKSNQHNEACERDREALRDEVFGNPKKEIVGLKTRVKSVEKDTWLFNVIRKNPIPSIVITVLLIFGMLFIPVKLFSNPSVQHFLIALFHS